MGNCIKQKSYEQDRREKINQIDKKSKQNVDKKNDYDNEVKIKFMSGEIIGFNPFMECLSMPPMYKFNNYTTGEKYNFEGVSELIHKIENYGIETNNIKFLEEAGIKSNHMVLNLEL